MRPGRASTGSALVEALGEYAAERASSLAIAEVDDEGLIVAANEPLERMAGRTLVGTPFTELVAPAQRATLELTLAEPEDGWQQRLLGLFPDERGVPFDFTVSLHRLDRGHVLIAEPAQVTVTQVNERLLALNDELARAQRQINRQNAELSRQNDRLRELDQLKDALLANVSHDLRTPLTAILGYAELMRRRGGLPPKQAQAAEVVERNARRLLRLVDDLLLLAQAEAGQLRFEFEPVDLGGITAEAYELARPLAEQASVQLRLDLGPGETVVKGDRLRLGQLLDNLIANAIKFTPAGGNVRVAVRASAEGGCLEVQDDGPGIPPAEQQRLYEAFVRGSAATAPGTGLGLAIVKAVADAHRARVELDSGADRGTRFTVCLPRSG